jgi:DNA repair protein RadA/Sms
MSEHPVGRVSGAPGVSSQSVLRLVPDKEDERIRTGFPHIDRVLGGGLVRGSVVLLAGAPGIGKSTLLLQLVSRLSEAGHSCLIASGEEARGQIAARASRLGLAGDRLSFVPGRVLAEVVAAVQTERPAILVVDSIHTIRDPGSDALPGGTAQVRTCADGLIELAKQQGVTVLLIGHVTKGGELAGPRTLEHAVDVVLTFEGDPRSGLRILSGGKNRFGAEGEVAWFRMGAEGLVESDAGPHLGEGENEPGCATALAVAGRRAFAVDVQALVAPTDGPPRRQASGLDPRRFQIIAAVADRASVDAKIGRSEVFGNCSGGLHLDDPGADLAVALALASAGLGRSVRPGLGFAGELSLTGTLRPAGAMDLRLSAAGAAGLKEVIVAAPEPAQKSAGRGIKVLQAGHLRDAIRLAFGP